MFGFFNKQPMQEAIDANTMAMAGMTAGVAFKIIEKKNGFTPVNETQELLETCKKGAFQILSINPDERSRTIIHMVAITFSMDETGFAEKITSRYQAGTKHISPEEVGKMWDMTKKASREVGDYFREK